MAKDAGFIDESWACESCGREYDPIRFRWRCPKCGYRDTCCEGAPQ